MTSVLPIAAELGARALLLLFVWLGSAIIASELSRSKGYGEKPGLGTGLLLSFLAPIIWLLVPPKDPLAEWHTRKPWQRRRKPKESEMASLSSDPADRDVKAGHTDVPASGARAGEEAELGSGPKGDQLGG